MRKLAYVVWVVHKNMLPRSKRDPAAKPASAYQVYLGVRRVHERRGYQMVDSHMTAAVMMVKAMNKRFVKKHGYQSLMKKRKEPLTKLMIERFLSLPEGTKLGCVTVSANSKGYIGWRCLNATAAQTLTGLRKDEVTSKTVAEGLTKVQFNRASLVFSVGGTMYADPDPQVLRVFEESDGVILKPRPSKADRFGAFWCDKPIFLPYRKHNKVCAARELVEQELMYPVRGVKRNTVPLLAADSGKPFSKQQVETAFKAMLKLVVPQADVRKFSFHGYRIYLACALDQAGCPPDKIKRILRWVSDEALRTYVRDGQRMYSQWLDKSASSIINTVQVSNLPKLEAMSVFIDCPEEDDDYESGDD